MLRRENTETKRLLGHGSVVQWIVMPDTSVNTSLWETIPYCSWRSFCL